MQKKKFSLTQLIFMALMAAVMCIAGPLAVPIGSGFRYADQSGYLYCSRGAWYRTGNH